MTYSVNLKYIPLYFMNNQEKHSYEPIWDYDALDILLYELCP